MDLPILKLGTDSSAYDKLLTAAVDSLWYPGASLEFGIRQGGSTELILRAAHAHNVKRPHVAVDPWGGLPYNFNNHTIVGSYHDAMRRQTCADLYTLAHEFESDLLIFAMKDTDFFRAFDGGVPFYQNGGTTPITCYSLVFFDAEHVLDAVMQEVAWCAPRTSLNGQWVFDDVNSYDHVTVDHLVLSLGFESLTGYGGMKAVYKKVR
jgi:hypothetical protein